MDKRSLLFLFCVSIAFFGVNYWFGKSQEKERLVEQKKIEEARLKEDQAWAGQVASRTAKLDQLPLVDFFADAKGEKRLGTAAEIEGRLLVLAWDQVLPKNIFVSKGDSFELASSSVTELGQPVIYGKETSPFSVPAIPESSQVDLQLVPVNEDPSRVVLGQQQKGKTSIPLNYLKEHAIAFLAVGDAYIPVGVYDAEIKRVKQLSEFKWLQNLVDQSTPIALTPPHSDEEFYVLENAYQQLVFSTFGGSLSEINLPLKASKDSKSLVREIDIDREILAQSPKNATFPLFAYHTPQSTDLNKEGSLGGYYPLLRRAILNQDGTVKSTPPPECYAMNIVGDDPEFSNLIYRVTRFEPNLIQFEAETKTRRITKSFSIPQERNGPYCFNLDIQIEGDSRGLMLSSGMPDVELVGGSYSPLLRYQVTVNGGSDVETIDLPKKGPLIRHAFPNWISNSNGYLGIIMDPLQGGVGGFKAVQFDGGKIPTRLSLIDAANHLYPPENFPGYVTYLPLKNDANAFRIFAGPYDDALLKELDEIYEDPIRNYNPDYAAAQSIQGWFSFISQPFAKFLFLLMQFFYTITSSWALSIILLTFALRAMMYPLNAWSIRSSVKMQEIAPKVKALQDKHKKDPKKAQLEVMNLYRESKVNPFTGCLPVLLQFPFLIGMFYLLKSSFPLRGAPFIPGWIDDLAAPDILFSWGPPIWFIGNEFHLLPILMGLTMYIQQKLTAKTPKDPSSLSESQKQQKMMGNMMSVLFTVMFYNFPSGLNIYFMFSTLLGIFQQAWMTRTKATRTAVIAK